MRKFEKKRIWTKIIKNNFIPNFIITQTESGYIDLTRVFFIWLINGSTKTLKWFSIITIIAAPQESTPAAAPATPAATQNNNNNQAAEQQQAENTDEAQVVIVWNIRLY